MDKIKAYLIQPSTWKGLIYVLGAVGIYQVSADVQDQLINNVIAIITGLFAISGVVDVIKDESKK